MYLSFNLDSKIRHRIKSGKLDAETIEGILHVVIDDNDIGTTIGTTPETENQHLIASLQQQVEHLQQTCDKIVTKNLNVSKNFTN